MCDKINLITNHHLIGASGSGKERRIMIKEIFRIIFMPLGDLMDYTATCRIFMNVWKGYIEGQSGGDRTEFSVMLPETIGGTTSFLFVEEIIESLDSLGIVSTVSLEKAEEFQKRHPHIPVTLFLMRDSPTDRKVLLHESWLTEEILHDIGENFPDIQIIPESKDFPKGELVTISTALLYHPGHERLVMGAMTRNTLL